MRRGFFFAGLRAIGTGSKSRGGIVYPVMRRSWPWRPFLRIPRSAIWNPVSFVLPEEQRESGLGGEKTQSGIRRPNARVRQIRGRRGEAWLPESGGGE